MMPLRTAVPPGPGGRREDTSMTQEQAAHVGRSARRAARSPALGRAARAGFAASGLVHLLVAYLVLRVAWTGGGQADQSGALSVLGDNPVGKGLLWLTA